MLEEAIVVGVSTFTMARPAGTWEGPFVDIQLVSTGEVLKQVPLGLGFGGEGDTGIPRRGDRVVVGFLSGSFGKRPIVLCRKPTAWMDRAASSDAIVVQSGERQISSASDARVSLSDDINLIVPSTEEVSPIRVRVSSDEITITYGDSVIKVDSSGVSINGEDLSLGGEDSVLIGTNSMLVEALQKITQRTDTLREEISTSKEVRTPSLTIASSDDADREKIAKAETLLSELNNLVAWLRTHTHQASGMPPTQAPQLQDFTEEWHSKVGEIE